MAENLTIHLLPWEEQLCSKRALNWKAKWKHINATATDDEAADAGNDLVKLNMAKNIRGEEAVKAFGEWVTNFDKTPIP